MLTPNWQFFDLEDLIPGKNSLLIFDEKFASSTDDLQGSTDLTSSVNVDNFDPANKGKGRPSAFEKRMDHSPRVMTQHERAEKAIELIAEMLKNGESVNEKEAILALIGVHDSLASGNSEIFVRSKEESGREISMPVTKEILIDLFLENLRK